MGSILAYPRSLSQRMHLTAPASMTRTATAYDWLPTSSMAHISAKKLPVNPAGTGNHQRSPDWRTAPVRGPPSTLAHASATLIRP